MVSHSSNHNLPVILTQKNGGYVNPPAEKRQFRDPYADWWDKQERRNYGEPVHEDNDILGMFSLEEYTHFKPGHGFFLLGCFIATTLGLCGVVHMFYPDKPSAPREFPDGLERELGGPRALPVGASSIRCTLLRATVLTFLARHVRSAKSYEVWAPFLLYISDSTPCW